MIITTSLRPSALVCPVKSFPVLPKPLPTLGPLPYSANHPFRTCVPAMGKRRDKGGYNDFLDGEKLRDNADVRTSLSSPSKPCASKLPALRPQKPWTTSVKKGFQGQNDSPKKPPLTHFLCLPLVTPKSEPQLDASLQALKSDLSHSGTIPPKAVRPAATLHLTLGVMALPSADQLDAAVALLSQLNLHRILYDITARTVAENAAAAGTVSENLIAASLPDPDELRVDLRGLVPMQAAHRTSVLYAEPFEASERLLPFAERLRKEFVKKGFMVDEKRSLRLHATIVNTVYAKPRGRGGGRGKAGQAPVHARGAVDGSNGTGKHEGDAGADGSAHEHTDDEVTTAPPDPSTAETEVRALEKQDSANGHGPNAKSWLRFDARPLIERYRNTVWAGDVSIDRVQICKMGAKKITNAQGEIIREEYQVVVEKLIEGSSP